MGCRVATVEERKAALALALALAQFSEVRGCGKKDLKQKISGGA
jgi:hypothetical protein